MALDLLEEFRPYVADRLVLGLVNLRQVSEKDFERTESGGVVMRDEARKLVLVSYQKRKQEEVVHPFLGERVAIGLLFHLQALLLARVRAPSPTALDARAAWRLATKGGAECLGRDDCGSLEVGKCADIACFRVDDLAHAGIKDLVAALALAPPARAQTVIVNGRVVVREGRLLTADEDEIAREIAATSARLAG